MPGKDVIAIILGGGRGTRLYPLTQMRAKPAVPLAGKYRLIDIPISNCINSGINRIYILTQFLSASLNRHVYDTYKFDVFSGGFIELLPAEQTPTSASWYQGTADAVRRQMLELRSEEVEDAIILAGDHLYRMDYSKFIDVHKEHNADLTIGAIPISEKNASRFGILQINKNNRITSYLEKPKDSEMLKSFIATEDLKRPYLASMGIYVFRVDVLTKILQDSSGADFGKDIIPSVLGSWRVHAYPFQGYWEDIGTISSFYEANIALALPEPAFDFYDPFHPIFTRSRYLPPSRMDGCTIMQSAISDGCKLFQANIKQSVIGLRSVVRPHVEFTRVVMMGADYYEVEDDRELNLQKGIPHIGIGNDSIIERAIIDKNARVGNRVVIRSHEGEQDQDHATYFIRDGIVVIPKNAVIPDGTII
jgi:glucose-1-phosphate adenylyltransferase